MPSTVPMARPVRGANSFSTDPYSRCALSTTCTDGCLVAALDHRSSLPPDTLLSVNLDASSLLDETVQRILRHQGQLGGLVIEITEHEHRDPAVLSCAACAPAPRCSHRDR